jgi:hypothetical protein
MVKLKLISKYLEVIVGKVIFPESARTTVPDLTLIRIDRLLSEDNKPETIA